jgi:hypothetical protein
MVSEYKKGDHKMKIEERFKLAQTLGQLDHVISFMEIEKRVASKLGKQASDEHTRGLHKGTIITVDATFNTLIDIRLQLEILLKG